MPSFYDNFNYQGYWQGRSYENLSEKRALKRLLKFIPKKGTIADIGSGYGRLTDTYLNLFEKIYLVDPSPELLKQAKIKLANQPKIKFLKGQAEKIPLKDNSLDAILMIRVSHHLPNLEKAISEIKRVLKPHGFLVLEFANKAHLKAIFKDAFKKDLFHLTSHQPDNLSHTNKIRVS